MRGSKRNRIYDNFAERIDAIRAESNWAIGPCEPAKLPVCCEGVKQTFAMYVNYDNTPFSRPMVKLTRVGGLVTLSSFYDMGRLPLHIGWGNGRVQWIALDGSKWLEFRSWDGFRFRVFIRDNGTCKLCGKVISRKDEHGYWPYRPDFVCDHIIPLFKGGKDWHEDPEMTNFQTLCVDCNKKKTRHDVSKLRVVKERKGIQTVSYGGFVFEQVAKRDHLLEKFC